MIIYNMRYRGPFEYDKFCLNILQFYNEVQHLTHFELSDQTGSVSQINDQLETMLLQYENTHVGEAYKVLMLMQQPE